MKTWIVVLVLASACSGNKEEKKEPKPAGREPAAAAAVKEPAAPPAKKVEIPKPAGWFSCKAPETLPPPAPPDASDPETLPFPIARCASVPAVFGKATFGIDPKAATAAIKGIRIEDSSYGKMGYLYLGKSGKKQQYVARFENDKLDEFSWWVGAKQYPDLVAAWGEPFPNYSLSDTYLVWVDPATKTKVIGEKKERSMGDKDLQSYKLEATRYVPLADLLGDALLAQNLIGKTPKELLETYKDQFVVKTKEEMRATVAAAGGEAAAKAADDMDRLAAAAGVGSDATAWIELDPNEVSRHDTSVSLEWKDGKLASYQIPFDYEKDTKLRDEILGSIAAKLGPPTETSSKGDACTDDNECKITFAGPNGLKVLVRPSMLDTGWRLTVSK